MKRTWTILGVGNVPGSFKWYQTLFGQPATPPAHDYFGLIRDSDGTVLLCLHQWGAHEHPSLMSPDRGTPGNGLLLFFRVDDFDLALQRARSLVPQLEEEPRENPNTHTKEFSRFEIRTDNTLRSVRSLRPDKALQVRLNQHRGQKKNAARLEAELAAARSKQPQLELDRSLYRSKAGRLKRFYRVIANDERNSET